MNNGEYRLIFSALRALPLLRRWTPNERQRWLAALEASVDLVVELIDEPVKVVETTKES